MRWFNFSVEDSYEYEDIAFRLECIIDDLYEEGKITDAICKGLSNWRIFCTKETLLTIFDRLYDENFEKRKAV